MALNVCSRSPHQLRKLLVNRQQAQHSMWLLGVTGTHTEQSLGTLEGSTSRVIVEKKVWCVCPCVCACTHAHVYKCVHTEREYNRVATHTSALINPVTQHPSLTLHSITLKNRGSAGRSSLLHDSGLTAGEFFKGRLAEHGGQGSTDFAKET